MSAELDEPVAVRLVARFPAGLLQLAAQAVGLVEVPRLARRLAFGGELGDLRRRLLLDRERLQAEDRQRAPQEVVVAPLVHDRERSRRREVVVERGCEALPRPAWLGLGRVAEDVAEA